jgi:hypothetical protein
MGVRCWQHLASNAFAYGIGGNGQPLIKSADTGLTRNPEGKRFIAAKLEPGGNIGYSSSLALASSIDQIDYTTDRTLTDPGRDLQEPPPCPADSV